MVHATSLLSIQYFVEEHGGLKTVLRAGQPSKSALTLLAQLCGPRASETEMGAALFPKNGERKTLGFDSYFEVQPL